MIIAGVVAIIGNMVCTKFGLDIGMLLVTQLFLILCSFFLPFQLAIVLGIVVPIISSLALGVPVLLYDGLFLASECAISCMTVSILYRKIELPSIISLVFGIIAGRIAICAVAFVMAGFFGFEENPVKFALEVTMNGLPGIIAQLFIIPLSIYGISKYTTLGID